MKPMNRREALKLAAALGASLAWKPRVPYLTFPSWPERRDLFPQGVASGDPHAESVLIWTRRPPVDDDVASRLTAQVAEDVAFHNVVAESTVELSAAADWTCRVLAAGLRPRREYWYRFIDDRGNASRVGRTLTAPAPNDTKPLNFAFVSCQNVQQGSCNAYRRMIWEDAHTPVADRLSFVLHLGDFVYEIVWYPEDRPQGMYDRRIRDIVRYPEGEKHADFHVPTTVEGYRALYRAYLADPDLQDARARWPFICMWDNHEFSWKGWQSQENFGRGVVPAQTRKVAAAQAWWDYQPARVVKAGPGGLNEFRPPAVRDAPLGRFDAHGLGDDPGNLAAIGALTLYRTFTLGAHVELVLTDNRSYRSEPLTDRPEWAPFRQAGVPFFESQDALTILDAGRSAHGGSPPETVAGAAGVLPNPRCDSPPGTILGARQREWFLERLRRSQAPWKVWGNSVGSLDWRTDLQHLPPSKGAHWTATGYGVLTEDDWSAYRTERNAILDEVRTRGIAGLVSICGDRHAFTAGRMSTGLPPEKFEPVGVEFITGSISAPGLVEAAKYVIPKNHPYRALYFRDTPNSMTATINAALRHGVETCLVLGQGGDIPHALAARNADVAPHLSFVDLGGHGYATVRATADALDVEFVCVPRPIERSLTDDGGPILYRVAHHVPRWTAGETPQLQRQDIAGTPPLLA
jgi:alkaline phosphatase D